MKKYRLPSREVFDRYAPAIRFNLIRGYHRNLTERHRWFVRTLDDYFYCDDFPTIPGAEVFDCNWTPDEWNIRPYRHFYNPIQDAWYTSYAREGLPTLREYDYGYTREDSKILRNGTVYAIRFSTYGKMMVHWAPLDVGSPLTISYKGIYSRSYNEELSQGTFMHCVPVKRVDPNVLIPVIREITKAKYEGVYEDVSEEIIYRFGVPINAL